MPDLDWREGFTHDASVLGNRSVRVLFGAGSLEFAPDQIRQVGGPALIVAGPHEDAAAEWIGAQLGEGLAGRLREVAQHVPEELAASASGRARATRAGCLVSVGGGSATGLAKAVALESGLPIVAVPTTYAGSEMTPIWGLTGPQGKATGRDQRVLPRTVIYDPMLTLGLPVGLSAASGLNAVAHALESLYAPDATEASSAVAEAGLTALAGGLPRVVDDPGDLDARSVTLYGAWLAGWALGGTTMGLHHKLAHVLGGSHDLPHAETHAVLLPHVAAFNAPAAPGAFAAAARALGVEGPDRVPAALFDLAELLGAPTSLAEVGLPGDVLDEVAATTMAAGVSNPREVTQADLVQLLGDAWAGVRP
jgi:maleylacetate reductase